MNSADPKYYYGIWFIGDGRSDWMASLFKNDGRWVLEYRFRYYDPNDPNNDAHSGKDKKSWCRAEGKDDSDETAEKLADGINKVLRPVMEFRYLSKMDFVDMHCRNDEPRFIEQLSSRKWAHMKKVTKEEFEKLVKEGRVKP